MHIETGTTGSQGHTLLHHSYHGYLWCCTRSKPGTGVSRMISQHLESLIKCAHASSTGTVVRNKRGQCWVFSLKYLIQRSVNPIPKFKIGTNMDKKMSLPFNPSFKGEQISSLHLTTVQIWIRRGVFPSIPASKGEQISCLHLTTVQIWTRMDAFSLFQRGANLVCDLK